MATHGDLFSWITAQADGTEHAVTYAAQAASVATGHGVYEAVCGDELLAASMDLGPVRRCARCMAILRDRATLCELNQRMAAREPAWLSRLCSRRSRRSGGRHRLIKNKENLMESGNQSAGVYASASVNAGVEIGVRLNSQGGEAATIGFGRDEGLAIDFCDVDSLERLAAVAADGARLLRERIAASCREGSLSVVE